MTAMEPFGPEAVAAVTRHMNDDHADDCLVICRALGGQPGAERATMTGMDETGLHFDVDVAGAGVPVTVPWRTVPADRAAVRTEVVRLHEAAVGAT